MNVYCEILYPCKNCYFSASDQGNMIPFHLTPNYEHVPRVLRGIAGVKWFRKTVRDNTWSSLTDTLLGDKLKEETLKELKEKIIETVNKEPDYYLSDPPYDKDTPAPGEPISVYDPPIENENSDDPSASGFQPSEGDPLIARSSEEQLPLPAIKRLRNFVRKKIIAKVFKSHSRSDWFIDTRGESNEIVKPKSSSAETGNHAMSSIECISAEEARLESSYSDNTSTRLNSSTSKSFLTDSTSKEGGTTTKASKKKTLSFMKKKKGEDVHVHQNEAFRASKDSDEMKQEVKEILP